MLPNIPLLGPFPQSTHRFGVNLNSCNIWLYHHALLLVFHLFDVAFENFPKMSRKGISTLQMYFVTFWNSDLAITSFFATLGSVAQKKERKRSRSKSHLLSVDLSDHTLLDRALHGFSNTCPVWLHLKRFSEVWSHRGTAHVYWAWVNPSLWYSTIASLRNAKRRVIFRFDQFPRGGNHIAQNLIKSVTLWTFCKSIT